jgi:WD40 repeat protein/cytoskeletal protein RodZ
VIAGVDLASPYKGLAPFEDSDLDALMFFGRERESDIVAMNLLASRLTVLYGPTGVGKSSLLRAGVARRLRELAPEGEVVVFSSWRDEPVAAIREAIAPGAETSSLVDAVETRDADVYLVLDQFEEYFLYHADARGPGSLVEELPELVNGDARVNVLLGIREDALAKLDVFKARLPRLFGNYLRLDHLDREAARAAILGPLARYSELTGEAWGAQPELVEAVLEQVEAGKIDIGQAGRALVERSTRPRVEAPFLQLVMHRLWEVERAAGSTTLTLASLAALGGAARIVEDHLEHALGSLTPVQQDTAAAIFEHLVTPSGSKIAHRLSDLATYAALDTYALEPIIGTLEHERILRALRDGTNGDGHYEIYHDVLAGAVLQWRERHEAQRALQLERARARDRHRRTLAALAVVGVALAIMTGLTIYAFSQRREAQQQAEIAQQQAQIARDRQAETAKQRAKANKETAKARKAEKQAKEAAADAKASAQIAKESQQKAEESAQLAQENAESANENAAAAAAAKNTANRNAAEAHREKVRADNNFRTAKAQRRKAEHNAAVAKAAARDAREARRVAQVGEYVALADANLDRDPQKSLDYAVRASNLETSDRVEGALRTSLMQILLHAVLPGGGGEVRDAVWSSDGALIGIVAKNGVTIIRVRDYRRLHFLKNANATTLAFSPDRRFVASGAHDGAVRIWDTNTGTLVKTLGTGGDIVSVAFSPDGRLLLAASVDKTARVWQVGSFVELRRFEHPAALRGAVFSPDGERVVTFTSDAAARVFDTASGDRVATLQQQGEVTAVAYSPTGDTVTTTGRRNGYVWDTKTWERRHLLVGHTTAITAVSYSADGKRVATSGGDEGIGRVWSVEAGATIYQLTGSFSELVTIAVGPDSVATAGTDGMVRIWRDPLGALAVVLAGHRDAVTSVAYGPGKLILTGSDDGTARVWDTGGEQQLAVVDRHSAGITTVETNRDATLVVSGGGDGVARIWRRGRGATVLAHGGKTVRAGLDLAAGRVLTWGDDGTAKLWRLDGTRIAEYSHDAPVNAAALSRDGRFVLTGGEDGVVRLWTSSGAPIAWAQQGSRVTAVAFSPNGATAATAGEDGVARLWNGRTGAPVRVLSGHTKAVTAIAFSPNSRLLATASTDDTARIWRLADGSSRRLVGNDDGLTSVAFSPNGKLLVTAGRKGDAKTWYVATGIGWHLLRRHVAIVSDARFSADGRWVVTAGPTAAGVWNTNDGTLLFFLYGHSGRLQTALFSGDGRWIVTGGAVDGTVRRYRCVLCGNQRELVGLAKAKLAALAQAHRAASGR